MVDVYSVTLENGSSCVVVDELDYFLLLLSFRSLIVQQRHALHFHDKGEIIACKQREDSILKYVSDYELWRKSAL